MRNVFADEVTRIAESDSRVVLLSGDIGNRLFDKLRAQNPSQFLNCGVAEQNMMGVAAGMGLSGLKPIVYTIAPFTTLRCLEQIKIDVAYHRSPVIIVGTGSGLSYASLGPTHHSLEDFATFRAIPNLQILAPWDAPSLRACLRSTLDSGKPTYIRIGKKGEKDITLLNNVPPIGSGFTLQQGSEACLLAVGTVATAAIDAADILAEQGIKIGVVIAHTVKPVSAELFDDLLLKYKVIVTIEEHSLISGFGESFLAYAAKKRVSRAIKTLGTRDSFMVAVGSQQYARKYFGIDAMSIADTALKLLREC